MDIPISGDETERNPGESYFTGPPLDCQFWLNPHHFLRRPIQSENRDIFVNKENRVWHGIQHGTDNITHGMKILYHVFSFFINPSSSCLNRLGTSMISMQYRETINKMKTRNFNQSLYTILFAINHSIAASRFVNNFIEWP